MTWAGLPVTPLLVAWLIATAALVALHVAAARRGTREARTTVVVPWLALFLDDPDGQEPARGWGSKGRLLPLLLSLLTLLALVLALGDPRPDPVAAQSLALVIDVSPSMATRELGARADDGTPPTRFDQAKAVATALVHEHAGAAMSVVALGRDATPVTPWTRDRRPLLQAIERLQVGTAEADANALAAYVNSPPGRRLKTHGGRILVVSDGTQTKAKPEPSSQMPEPGSPIARHEEERNIQALPREVVLTYHPVGEAENNLALQAMSARRYPFDPDRAQALVTVVNGGASHAQATLTLRADGLTTLTDTLSLAPFERLERTYEVSPVDHTISAELSAVDAGADALPDDNRAVAALPPRGRTRVLCVTDGDLFLQAVLLSDDTLVVDTVTPDDLRPDAARTPNPRGPAPEDIAVTYDVVVFDGIVPPWPSPVPSLYLRPEGDGDGQPLDVRGELTRPRFDQLQREDPLLRQVALSDINIANALRLDAAPSDTVVAADADGPLLLRGQRQGVPFVALAFHPRDSDLPLRAAWPLLLRNVLDGFVERPTAPRLPVAAGRESRVTGSATGRTAVAGGEPRSEAALSVIRLYPTDAANEDAAAVGWRTASGLSLVAPRPGLYRGAEASTPGVAVGPDVWVEPAVAPAPALRVGERSIRAAPERAVPATAARHHEWPTPTERPAPWLLLSAVPWLLGEWWIQRRGGWR